MTDSSRSQSKLRSTLSRHRTLLIAIAMVAMLFVAALVGLPYGIAYLLVAELEDAGARQARIENVDYNPFTGELTIEGLDVDGPDGRAGKLQRLSADLDNDALFQRRVFLEQIAIVGGRVDVDLPAGGPWRIAGIPLGRGQESPAPEADSEGGERWQVGLGRVGITDSAVTVHAGGTQETFRIDTGAADQINMWDPGAGGDMLAQLQLPEGALKVDGIVRPFQDNPALSLTLKGEAIALAPLFRLAPADSKQIEGLITTDLRLEVASGEGTLTIRLDGEAAAERLSVDLGGRSVGAGHLAWSGTATLALGDGTRIEADGTLEGDNVVAGTDQGEFAVGSLRVAADGLTVAIPTDGGVDADMRLDLRLAGIEGTVPAAQLQRGTVTWNGQVEIDAPAGPDGAMRARADGTLAIDDLGITASERGLQFAHESLRYEGRLSYGDGATAAVTAAGTLALAGVAYDSGTDDGARSAELRSASIAGLNARYEPTADGRRLTSIAGAVDLAGLRYRGGGTELNQEGLQWSGDVTSSFGGTRPLESRLQGTGEANGFRIALGGGGGTSASADNGTRLTARRLTAREVEANLTAGAETTRLEFAGAVAADELRGARGDAQFQQDRLAWQGPATVAVSAAGAIATSGEGRLTSDGLDLRPGVGGLRLRQGGASWEGRFAIALPPNVGAGDTGAADTGAADSGPADTAPAATVERLDGRIEMREVRVDSSELDFRVLEFSSLTLSGTAKAGEAIAAEQLVVERLSAIRPAAPVDFDAGEGDPAVLDLDRLVAESLRLDPPQRLTVDSVTLSGASVDLLRDQDGELALVNSLLRLAGEVAEGEGGPEEPDFTFAVDRWILTGGSRLSFTDRSVTPAVRVTVEPFQAVLRQVDNAAPDRPSPLTLEARFGKYSSLNLTGQIKPFADRLNLQLEGTLEGFELPSVSGYAREYLGYDLQSGRLDAQVDIDVDDGQLDARSTLTLTRLNVAPTDPEKLDPLRQRADVPLETALNLLRDRDDVIRLEVPVAGQVSDPKFDFSDAVNQAIGGAIKNTLTTLLKVAFPIGGVISAIAESSGERALRLQPVPFEAGSAALSGAARDHLDQVAALMQERPAIRLTICPRVTDRDRQALGAGGTTRPAPGQEAAGTVPSAPQVPGEAARLLDRRRGETVKDALIDRGIAEPRLFLCAPTLDDGGSPEPRVELRF